MNARLRISWLLAASVLAGALVIGALGDSGPTNQQERVYDIASQVKCPECGGQTVAESDTASARAIRIEIASMLSDGSSHDEILDGLVASYGPQIVLTPTSSGVTGLVWIIPVVAAVCALAGLFLVFRRWSAQGSLAATDADRELVARAQGERAPEPEP